MSVVQGREVRKGEVSPSSCRLSVACVLTDVLANAMAPVNALWLLAISNSCDVRRKITGGTNPTRTS